MEKSRRPGVLPAARLFSRVDEGDLSGFISATTVTTIHCLARGTVGDRQARNEIRNMLDLFDVAPVNHTVLEGALESNFTDFEDAVLHQAALDVNAGGIVTRNTGHFKPATIPVYAPDELDRLVQITDEIADSHGHENAG